MSVPPKTRPGLSKLTPVPTGPPLNDVLPDPDVGPHAVMEFQKGSPVDVSVDDLVLLNTLGRGQYGQVDCFRHNASGFQLAVKRIRLTDDPEMRKRTLMDLQVNSMMSGGQCPYLVRFYGALTSQGDLWICMEFMDISLESFYKKVSTLGVDFPEQCLAYMTFAIVSGLQFLYKDLNIMHRDVKPSNILLSRKGELKLCDFGISGRLNKSLCATNIGCSLYMPPERLTASPMEEGSHGFDIRSDVWSVGITMIEVAIGKHPYPTWKNAFQQISQVVNGPPPTLPDGGLFSDNFRNFVGSCCQKNYRDRPKYVELLKHPFIDGEQDLAVSETQKFVNMILDSPVI